METEAAADIIRSLSTSETYQPATYELHVAGTCETCGHVQGIVTPLVQSLQFSIATVCVRCGTPIESVGGAVRVKEG